MKRAVLAFLVACGSAQNTGPIVQPAKLGDGVIAIAGSVEIQKSLVEDVARKNNETPNDAVSALIFDAVLAQAATQKKLDQGPDVRVAQRSARARFVLDRIADNAKAQGAVTDEEVRRISARHWREVDLPEQAHAVHVVVMTKDASKKALMRAVAEDVRRAVLPAKDADDFIARAKQVDARGLEIRPENLPPFVADGRAVTNDGTFDTTFTSAAFALQPGETSGVVETKFGLHVIRMLERIPAKIVPFEERRALFAAEAIQVRGHDAYTALLADLKRRHPVVVAPAAEALMSQIAQSE